MQAKENNIPNLFIFTIIIFFNKFSLYHSINQNTIIIMKKSIILTVLIFSTTQAIGNQDPFFSGYTQQITFNIGAGVNSGFLIPPPSQFVPYTTFQVQYSQPTTFFSLPARQSISAVINVGYGQKYGWHWEDFSIPIITFGIDTTPIYGQDWYTFIGIGVGMQAQQNARIGSKLLFSFKAGYGYRLSDCTSLELFMQHMSNGNTAPENNSYAFYGIGLSYSF